MRGGIRRPIEARPQGEDGLRTAKFRPHCPQCWESAEADTQHARDVQALKPGESTGFPQGTPPYYGSGVEIDRLSGAEGRLEFERTKELLPAVLRCLFPLNRLTLVRSVQDECRRTLKQRNPGSSPTDGGRPVSVPCAGLTLLPG